MVTSPHGREQQAFKKCQIIPDDLVQIQFMHFLLVKLDSSIHLFSHVVCEKPCAEEENQCVLLVKYIELSKGSKRGSFLVLF